MLFSPQLRLFGSRPPGSQRRDTSTSQSHLRGQSLLKPKVIGCHLFSFQSSYSRPVGSENSYLTEKDDGSEVRRGGGSTV